MTLFLLYARLWAAGVLDPGAMWLRRLTVMAPAALIAASSLRWHHGLWLTLPEPAALVHAAIAGVACGAAAWLTALAADHLGRDRQQHRAITAAASRAPAGPDAPLVTVRGLPGPLAARLTHRIRPLAAATAAVTRQHLRAPLAGHHPRVPDRHQSAGFGGRALPGRTQQGDAMPDLWNGTPLPERSIKHTDLHYRLYDDRTGALLAFNTTNSLNALAAHVLRTQKENPGARIVAVEYDGPAYVGPAAPRAKRGLHRVMRRQRRA